MQNKQKLLLTTTEAAAEIGMPYYFVRRLIRDGNVKAIKSGTRYYIIRSSLYDFLGGGDKDDIQT